MMYRIVLLCAALLAGCETTAQREAKESEQQAARATAYRNHVRAQCIGYGFTEGTDEYRRCLMQVDMSYRQQNEAQRQMLLQEYMRGQGAFRRP